MRAALLTGAALLLTTPAWAQSSPAHAVRDTLMCANPEAVRALDNRADPRQADPNWVNFVRQDAGCIKLSARRPVVLEETDGYIATISYTSSNGQHAVAYVPVRDIAVNAGRRGG